MKKLLKKLINWFSYSQQTDLENYINTHHPQNASDIDYLTRQFEYNQRRFDRFYV